MPGLFAGLRLGLLGGTRAPQLAFTSATSIAEDFNGVAFTLFVSNAPAGVTYAYAEVTDADNIATIAGDEVTIAGTLDYETATSHTLVYSATPDNGGSVLTLTITVTVTDVSESRDVVTYLSKANNTGAGNSYTFSAVGLGAAGANRFIVVAVAVEDTQVDNSISGVTIGGVSASSVVSAGVSASEGGNWIYLRLFAANVPTGTTGDIVVSLGFTANACGIGVWSLDNPAGGVTAHDTDFEALDGGSGTTSLAVDVPASGCVIVASAAVQSSNPTFTFTNITEDFDALFETAWGTHGGASKNFVAAQTALDVSVDSTATTGKTLAVAASWGAA